MHASRGGTERALAALSSDKWPPADGFKLMVTIYSNKPTSPVIRLTSSHILGVKTTTGGKQQPWNTNTALPGLHGGVWVFCCPFGEETFRYSGRTLTSKHLE